MEVNQKKVTLNDGSQIPVIGLGTYLSAPNEVSSAVIAAWKEGVRHFDCAQFYRNEVEVGDALRSLAEESNFDRKDIWLTSKLGTDYVDLYLIHWPVNFAAIPDPQRKGKILLEPQENGKMLLDEELSLVDTWKAMIEVQKSGKARSIGVSNFLPSTIQSLIDATGIVPSVNQVEAHPYLIQQDLVDYCSMRGIHMTAYMPFGGDSQRGGPRVLGNPLVAEISRKFGKDPGQVLGSWGIKRGFSVLPKSVKPARIASNFQVFELDDESYERLTELGRRHPTRFGGIPCTFDPAWRVNVFDTPEERTAGLLEPF